MTHANFCILSHSYSWDTILIDCGLITPSRTIHYTTVIPIFFRKSYLWIVILVLFFMKRSLILLIKVRLVFFGLFNGN
jgi:hypothetical protein